jgi:Leucine-rich repeat (LRR) protein
MHNRLLLLFSILIDESKQATLCEWKPIESTPKNQQETKLSCKQKGPSSENDWSWSLEGQSTLIPSNVHHFLFNNISINSFKSGIFAKFTNANTINLSGNKLSAINFNEFANNSKLQNFYVSNNKITDIKPINSSTEISIATLMIYNNDLTDISELCKLKKMKMLNLSGNRRLDYSKVTFSCWSELTHLYLANTNLKNLNHDYRMLTGCNQLIGLDFSNNHLEMLCFGKLPVLPKLNYLNINNNSLIKLDVAELKKKCQILSSILIAGNKWSCAYYWATLKTELEKSKINGTISKADCLEKSENSETSSCPRIESNYTNSTTQQKSEHTKGSGMHVVTFWIFFALDCVLLVVIIILFLFSKI